MRSRMASALQAAMPQPDDWCMTAIQCDHHIAHLQILYCDGTSRRGDSRAGRKAGGDTAAAREAGCYACAAQTQEFCWIKQMLRVEIDYRRCGASGAIEENQFIGNGVEACGAG